MKKIFLFMALIMTIGLASAQDETLTPDTLGIPKEKPTDEEIMQVIDKFNFTPEQKQTLFNETKKNIELLYSEGNVIPNSNAETKPEIMPPSDTENLPKKEKKYSKHGKYGPKHD